MDAVEDDDQLVERVAGIDVGKAEVVCCVRVPDAARPGRRAQEVKAFSTMTASLLELADWLRTLGVSRVVMESTSDYWRPVFYALEASGFTEGREPWLVNARDVKHLPGRPKTDRIDAVWLAKLAERGMLRASFVPPAPIRQLRDLTRYRADLVVARNGFKQRAEKLLEDAQIKVSVVASDLFGVSGRAMMNALVAGERSPDRLAELARGVLRKKTPELREALTGRFNDHHGFMLGQILAQYEELDAAITRLEERIEVELAPLELATRAMEVLDEIPGIDRVAAASIIAEIGLDMTRFPTAGHLCSWAGFAPIAADSAGRSKKRRTGTGSRYLARTLGNAVAGSAATHTFLGERYRRLAKRRGKNVAMVACGRTILIEVWHLLSQLSELSQPSATDTATDTHHHELGENWHASRATHAAEARKIRRQIRELEAHGFTITKTPAA